MRKKHWKPVMLLLLCVMLATCGNAEIEDYATNEGYTVVGSNVTSQVQQENGKDNAQSAENKETGISVEKVKIGVVHLTSPDDGNGYTYTHDLGIQGMERNLGLSKEQVVRKLNAGY